MNLKIALCTLGLLVVSNLRATPLPASSFPHPKPHFSFDSVGVERRNGKYFVKHKVTQGQTLYAIARRYNTSVEFIKAANPGMTDAVRYNQIVRVPQPEPELSRKEDRAPLLGKKSTRKTGKEQPEIADQQLMKPTEAASKTESKGLGKAARKEAREDEKAAQRIEAEARKNTDIHVVEAGQTLYSLAVKYKVLMADLRRWNNLANDNILLGQALIISEKGYTARQAGCEPLATTKPEAKPEAPRKEAPKPENRPENSEVARPTPPTENPPILEERPIKPGEPGNRLPTKGRRIAEIGMAERIEADESSNKYLALHRSAPVGSLVQVRNDVNHQSLWVKVIGRLPDTGVNERVLIKLSAKAFEKLSPNNQSFRAEVSYMVP